MGRGDRGGRVPAAGGQQARRPVRIPPPAPDRQPRPRQRAHHRVAEGVRDDDEHDQSGVRPRLLAPPADGLEGADRRRPPPGPAEGQEVVLADQRLRRRRHGRHVELPVRPQHGAAAQRVAPRRSARGVGDPVDVAARQGGEAGVEAGRREGGPVDHDIGRPPRQRPDAAAVRRLARLTGQDAGQALPQGPAARAVRAAGQGQPGGLVHVDVRRLRGGVHPGVRAPGHGQLHGVAHDGGQGPAELALDGAQPGLGGPAAEAGAVVGQVQAHPHAPGRRGGGGVGVGHGPIRSRPAPAGAPPPPPGSVVP